MPTSLTGRNFLKLLDFTPEEIRYLYQAVQRIQEPQADGYPPSLPRR